MSSAGHLSLVPDGTTRVQGAIRVVIAEDHAQMRSSLCALLEESPGTRVIAEADDLAAAREKVTIHRPDVLVLDLCMATRSSLGTLSDLRQRSPTTHTVVVSVEASAGFAALALAAGASGYVVKDRADEDLPAAVAAAAEGREYLSEPIAAALASSRQARTGGSLSLRETEVLRLIALGYTSAEIAARLALSPRTIETHRANIHKKLELRTRAELVGYALRCGLLST